MAASTTLEEKINKIRQKNEEIRRRHEEVEADKQNAAKLNALVKMVPPTDWPERKEPPEFSNPLPPSRSNGNNKAKSSSGREYRGQQQQYHAGGGDGKKTHVFAEGDGPPPDPTYNFLADSEREERTREDFRENDRFRGRGGPLRGSSRKRGGGREGYSKEYRGSAGPKDSSKPEYEAWRAERNRIDEARISRQRTAEGNWRREWDNNKMNVEEDEGGVTKSTRLDIGDGVRKDHKEFDKWQIDGNDHDSPRGRGGKPYVSRGGQRGSHNNRVYHHSNSFDQFHGPVSPLPTKPPLSPNGIDDRMVVATDKSIKVIVNHGTTPPKGPVMSVKVSSSSIAGTGRVGPRQKPRVLYSSQSETEVPAVYENEKFSGYKSPDDKSNRVSFNRDIEEQQRYAPKSPHPQRKADIKPKSPYTTRKEFKYDSQQQRHGEADPKSPYLQRKEAKDSPKSPHFQRKQDFANRDHLAKQKNNNQATESFKPTHLQRRTSDKTKYDSQKFSGPRKPEDPSAPKPQRTNKRTEKSKNSFQQSNSKETQKSSTNEDNTQLNNPAINTLEEYDKSIVNGVKIHDEVCEGNDNGDKDSSGDVVAVETLKENQNEEDDARESNVNVEILSPANIDLEKVDESFPEDTKLIDQSKTTIHTLEDANLCSENSNADDNETVTETIVLNVETNTVSESITAISTENEVEKSTEKDLIVKTVDVSLNSEENKVGESNEEVLVVENVEPNKITVSETLISIESKADECNDQKLIEQNVESNGIPESAALISGESKAEECNVIVTDVKESEELPEITNGEEKNVEIQTLIENETCKDSDEVKNTESISEDEPKDEVNSNPSADPENLLKLEEKIICAKSELQSDKNDEASLPLEAEKISNEDTQNIVESTSLEKKVDASYEIETHQSGEKQISNNVDEQIVKDSEDKENPVI